MVELISFFITNTVLAGMFVRIDRRIPNPVLLRCSACDAKIHLRPHGWVRFFDIWLWLTAAWLIVWRLNPPFMLGCLMVLVLIFPWNMAKDRLWHAYWVWKHPLRCQGGGHIAPSPTSA